MKILKIMLDSCNTLIDPILGKLIGWLKIAYVQVEVIGYELYLND
jgi:hypothetical protein